MNVSPAQYASLAAVFTTPQVQALLDFLSFQFNDAQSSWQQAVAAAIAALPVPQWNADAVRAKDAAFTPSQSRFTLGFYTMELFVPLTVLITSGSASAAMFVNGTQQGSTLQAPTGALGLSQTLQGVLIGLTPPNGSALIQTTTTGNGTAAIVSTTEFFL